jgi:hypothetical protein
MVCNCSPDGAKRNPGFGDPALQAAPGFRGACHRAGHFRPDPLALSGLGSLGTAMMHSFALSRHRRANGWLDEAPPADFTASSTVTRVVRPKVVVHATRRIAGVEINIPHGPRASYALLGADLVESDVDGLEVIVSVGAKGPPFAPSLALKPDDVKTGLLDEYAGAVVTGIERVAESGGLPANVSLRFRWAAYGLVGSSPSVFADVSGFVARLLILPKDASERQVDALFG